MKSPAAIAKILLECGVVSFRPDDPFTYSSGIRSPIYMDNRVLISFPDARKQISLALEELARTQHQQIEIIAGTATAGIPWAAWMAAGMNIPMVYVRDKAKSHGQQNQIEGVLEEGKRTLVVEDLVSTGGSCLNAADAVKTAGSEPLGVVAIYTYGMQPAKQAFELAGLPLHTLTDFKAVVDTAVNEGRLTAGSREQVLDWIDDPAGWAKRMGLE